MNLYSNNYFTSKIEYSPLFYSISLEPVSEKTVENECYYSGTFIK